MPILESTINRINADPLETQSPSSGFITKVFRKIEDIDPAHWNAVYPNVLEGYRFFKSLDESNLEQFSFYYIMVYQEGIPAGAATCFLMEYPVDTTLRGFLKSAFVAVKNKFPKLLNLKVLMCGQPTGQGRIGFSGDTDKVMKAIRKCVENIAEKEKTFIVAYKEFGKEYADALHDLETNGYYRFESLPNTMRALGFKDFDEYLMSLSYPTRYDLKRKFKKVDGRVPIKLEVRDHLNGVLDEAYDLYCQMISRHEMGFEVMSKEFFSKISENMPSETKFFLWRIDQKLVAFAFCLISGDHFLDYYLGLDYAVAYNYHLYFVRFRDMMKWCLDNGMKTYEMGCTNYDPKKRLGFEFVPLSIYVKFRNKFINRFSKYICDFIEPQKHDPFLSQMAKKQMQDQSDQTRRFPWLQSLQRLKRTKKSAQTPLNR